MEEPAVFLASYIEEMITRASKRYGEELRYTNVPPTRVQHKDLHRLKASIDKLLAYRTILLTERVPGSTLSSAEKGRKPARLDHVT